MFYCFSIHFQECLLILWFQCVTHIPLWIGKGQRISRWKRPVMCFSTARAGRPGNVWLQLQKQHDAACGLSAPQEPTRGHGCFSDLLHRYSLGCLMWTTVICARVAKKTTKNTSIEGEVVQVINGSSLRWFVENYYFLFFYTVVGTII